MNCERCGGILEEGDSYQHRGKVFCEDCYIGALQPPKACDVAAVEAAKSHRQLAGQTGTDGLTEVQKNLYEYVCDKGKATKTELMEKFQLPDWELEKQFSILRHCELLKGRKEGALVYVVPFNA